MAYNVFRYYDPGTARYISADPLGLRGGPNPAAYVDNPTALVDPLGLSPCVPDSPGADPAQTTPPVLKGPIEDAVPRTLPEQLALGAAWEGRGSRIMGNLADEPRLVANYGLGEWVKMQYVMRGIDGNVTVHYFRNLTTNLNVEFKFK